MQAFNKDLMSTSPNSELCLVPGAGGIVVGVQVWPMPLPYRASHQREGDRITKLNKYNSNNVVIGLL